MDVRSHVLTANQVLVLNQGGRFFMLVSASVAVAEVQFVKKRSTTRETARNIEAGYVSFPGDWKDREDRFDGIRITNGATAQTIQVGISDRAADYRRVVGIVQIQQPDTIETQADASVTTTVAGAKFAANGNRRKAIVQHVSGTGVGRLGDAAITATRGARLVVGASITIDATAAIFARTETGTATISIFEETRT